MIKGLRGLLLTTWLMSTSTMAADFSKFEQLAATLEQKDKAMLAVAVRQNGKLIFEHYTGLASLKPEQEANRDSTYRFGSVSKVFVATMTLQAVEEGKLSLEHKLSQFFPDVPNASRISIEHLLNHRSGVFNFTDAPDYPLYMTQSKSREALLSIIRGFEPVFEPGEKHDYSNSNYVLLSLILEQLYDMELARLLEMKIAKPLKLTHTRLGIGSQNSPNDVSSFRFLDKWQEMPRTDLSIPMGAGAVISNVKDISHFLTQLFAGKLISDESLAKMKSMKDGYGLGLMAFPFYERWGLGHGGAIDGFLSNAAYFEDEKLAISVISNGLNYNFNDVLIALLSSYYDKPFDLPDLERQPVRLASDTLAAYTGEFASKTLPMDIQVFVDNGRLMGQATGQQAFELTPYSTEEFHFEAAGIVMHFNASKTEFVLVQGGGRFRFSRKP